MSNSDAKFLTFDNFQLAWHRIRTAQQRIVKDRLALKVFAAQSNEQLEILMERVQAGKYSPQVPEIIAIPKPNNSIRKFPLLCIQDAIIYQSIGNIIIQNSCDDIYKVADNVVFAHIPNLPKNNGKWPEFVFKRAFSKGFEQGQFQKFENAILRDMTKTAEEPDTWIVETDIASFYPSIDHTLLLNTIQMHGWLTDTSLITLLENCLETWSSLDGKHQLKRGLPIAQNTSDLLATLYLLDMENDLVPYIETSRRYVDDMYFFVRGKNNADKLIHSLDSLLERKGLLRNSEKTKTYLSDSDTLQKRVIKRSIRKQTSFIDEVLEVSDTDTQAELIDVFNSIYNGMGECAFEDVNLIIEQSTEFSFVLNRLEEKYELVKNVALCILGAIPHMSFPATKYLWLFEEDALVIEELFKVSKESVYSEVRINCTKALKKILGVTNDLRVLLVNWTQEDDWQLRLAALNFLTRNYNDRGFFLKLGRNDSSVNVRAKALYEASRLSKNDEELIEIVNLAWEDSNEYIQLLGIFLRRRYAHISTQHFNTGVLSEDFFKLLLTLDEKGLSKLFFSTFLSVFGFEIDKKLGVHLRGFDFKLSIQALINMEDAETDTVAFIQALYEFTLELLFAIIRRTHPQFKQKSFATVINKLHPTGEAFAILSKLRLFNELASEDPDFRIQIGEKNNLFQNTRNVVAADLAYLYDVNQIKLPPSFRQFLDEVNIITEEKGEMRNQVFISYSHKDVDWLSKLNTHLKPLIRNRGLATWDDTHIKPGEQWKEEIKEALAKAKVGVLLVSPYFLESDFIHSEEFTPILDDAKKQGLTVVWILISECLYEETEITNFQAAYTPLVALDSLSPPEQNAALKRICQSIKQAFLA